MCKPWLHRFQNISGCSGFFLHWLQNLSWRWVCPQRDNMFGWSEVHQKNCQDVPKSHAAPFCGAIALAGALEELKIEQVYCADCRNSTAFPNVFLCLCPFEWSARGSHFLLHNSLSAVQKWSEWHHLFSSCCNFTKFRWSFIFGNSGGQWFHEIKKTPKWEKYM